MLRRTTQHTAVRLIGAASGYGAKDKRCQDGPERLRASDLTRRLIHTGISTRWHILKPKLGTTAPIPLIHDLSERLARQTYGAVINHERFAVIGGDHACAVGTWSGAYQAIHQRGPLGLLWLDAHLDSHTPETSPSGSYHGMPVASLLGHGDVAWRDTAIAGPKLRPEHLCIIGVRSYELEEYALLGHLGVRVMFMDEVRDRGVEACMREGLDIVRNGTAGYGVSIDLDAIDPTEAPGVGSPVADGLSADAILRALRHLSLDEQLLGIEIAELNPHLDVGGMTAQLTSDLIVAVYS